MAVSDPKRLSEGALNQAQWALVNELASLLEHAQTNVEQLRDDATHLDKWPLTADTRAMLRQIPTRWRRSTSASAGTRSSTGDRVER